MAYFAAILARGGDPILGAITGVIFLVIVLVAWALGLGKRDPNNVRKDELFKVWLFLGVTTQHAPSPLSAL